MYVIPALKKDTMSTLYMVAEAMIEDRGALTHSSSMMNILRRTKEMNTM